MRKLVVVFEERIDSMVRKELGLLRVINEESKLIGIYRLAKLQRFLKRKTMALRAPVPFLGDDVVGIIQRMKCGDVRIRKSMLLLPACAVVHHERIQITDDQGTSLTTWIPPRPTRAPPPPPL